MTFRRKLSIIFTLTVVLCVAGVASVVLTLTRNAFEKTEDQQTTALVTQFQREFDHRGEDVAQRVERIAGLDVVVRMAANPGDSASYFDLAHSMAESWQLDFLEFLDENGKIISSAQSPAKFGYADPAFKNLAELNQQAAFLKLEELSDSNALGLFAVRATRVGDHPLYVIGGRRLDKAFLSALDLSPGMRVLLYENRTEHFAADSLLVPGSGKNASRPADKFAGLVEAVRSSGREMTGVVKWSADAADEEVFHAIPLRGVGAERPLLGVLLIGNSQAAYAELKRRIRDSALLVGGAGIVLAILFSSWAAARVTRPVEQLARAAKEVAEGDWNARVEVAGRDEIAQLAESFNAMTSELLAQKERLVQTERVAAWRELARRLAHELKNPLFPLQLTVENLVRARDQHPEQFEEVLRESSTTLLAEISNLKAIIGRFSEFSKMPQPQLQKVGLNEIVRGVAQLFQAQLKAPGRTAIACKLELDEKVGWIEADQEMLHRAISNLVLNAMDAMPEGGTLTLRTRRGDGTAVLEVADSGSGLTREECERIFTPYYTSKEHGTGLGLAIVQSVVSDHEGRISVKSEPGRGSTFVIELPVERHSPQRTQRDTEKIRG
jgi:signal transduction histidine kinase